MQFLAAAVPFHNWSPNNLIGKECIRMYPIMFISFFAHFEVERVVEFAQLSVLRSRACKAAEENQRVRKSRKDVMTNSIEDMAA